MKNFKIYVVTDVEKFKSFCEEKLGNNITADDYITLESFKEEQIQLIPKYYSMKDKYYISLTSKQESIFNIYLNIKNNWIKKNLINILENDIDDLLDDDIIEDLEEHKNWVDIFAYKIINQDKFNEKILPCLTDEEAIAYLSVLNRSYNNTTDIFIVSDNDKFKILVKNTKVGKIEILPYTTLEKYDLLNFIKKDVISYCKCKINKEEGEINLDGIHYDFELSQRFAYGRMIRPVREDKYVARGIYNDKLGNAKVTHAFGRTGKETIHKLREKMEKLSGHSAKSTQKTIDLYNDHIDTQCDYDI